MHTATGDDGSESAWNMWLPSDGLEGLEGDASLIARFAGQTLAPWLGIVFT